MNIDSFRVAVPADAPAIATLVNAAYRPADGNGGWTHESAFISGDRTTATQVRAAMSRDDSAVLLGLTDDRTVACVQVEHEGSHCYIGMLAVLPALQGAGIGKEMLAHAERYAVAHCQANEARMLVVSARSELIAFYLRRGYVPTDTTMPYPSAAGVGRPRRDGITIQVLAKPLA